MPCEHKRSRTSAVRQEASKFPRKYQCCKLLVEEESTQRQNVRMPISMDIHRPIRASVPILILQDYKHCYTSTCTARTILGSRTLARDTHQ